MQRNNNSLKSSTHTKGMGEEKEAGPVKFGQKVKSFLCMRVMPLLAMYRLGF